MGYKRVPGFDGSLEFTLMQLESIQFILLNVNRTDSHKTEFRLEYL